MKRSSEHQRALDEVYMLVGRNVLLYQQIEQQLKYLTDKGYLAGTTSQLIALLNERESKPNRKMLGELINPLVERHLHSKPPADPPISTSGEGSMAFQISFPHTEAESAIFKEQLETMVSERNGLIHHAWEQFELTNEESCQKACVELQKQYDRALPIITKLSGMVRALGAAAGIMKDIPKEWFLPGQLRQSE